MNDISSGSMHALLDDARILVDSGPELGRRCLASAPSVEVIYQASKNNRHERARLCANVTVVVSSPYSNDLGSFDYATIWTYRSCRNCCQASADSKQDVDWSSVAPDFLLIMSIFKVTDW